LLLQPVQKAFQASWGAVSGFSQSVFEAEAIRRKNEALLQEIARLQNQVQQLQESGRRWEDLKSAFQIKETFSDYEIVGCQVMTRSAASWFDLFRVDVGDRDGISVTETNSYPVVDPAMHLVGRVYSSDLVSAKILPVVHQGSVVDGRIQRPGGYPVRVRGDILLRDEGLCFVDRISDEAILEVGDVVMTSGEGGLYPAGIPIGTIASISYGQNDAERTATLKPFVDFDTITYLFIMKEKAS
jgi:rod shape-determining protein MreC